MRRVRRQFPFGKRARRLLELALLVAQFKVHGPAPYLRLMVVLTLPTEAASVNQRWVIVCVCV